MHDKPDYTSDTVLCDIVAAKYTGKMAKWALAHSTTYQIVQQGGKGDSQWVIAFFRRPATSLMPPHLTKITDLYKIKRFEDWREGHTEKGSN